MVRYLFGPSRDVSALDLRVLAEGRSGDASPRKARARLSMTGEKLLTGRGSPGRCFASKGKGAAQHDRGRVVEERQVLIYRSIVCCRRPMNAEFYSA